MRAQFVAQEIWIGLRRNLTMTVAVIVTVAISLALLGSGFLLFRLAEKMKGEWYDKVEVSIFMCNDVATKINSSCRASGAATEDQRNQIQQDLEQMPQVAQIFYEDEKQAYQRFKERFSNLEAFVKGTKEGDIPDSFRVKLKDPERYREVVSAFEGRPGVQSVNNERATLQRFFGMLNGLRNSALIIAFIQLVATILLVGNTIRLAAFSRRRETGIMRLVGASNFYIQLPFLLEGAVAGLIGGMIAAGLLSVAKLKLFDQLQQHFNFNVTLTWNEVIFVIVVAMVIGVLLCALASMVTLRRYLRV